MNEIEIRVNGIKEYELKIWQSGLCSSLARIAADGDHFVWNSSGYSRLKDYVRTEKRSNVTESFCKLLSALRMIIEAEKNASDYLINEHSISIDKDDIWLDLEGKRAVLLPVNGELSSATFFERICKLSTELGFENLTSRLEEKNREKCMNESMLLQFLSSWELELRQ